MHIGLILPPFHGHLNPGVTLGNAIKERGHKVTLISQSIGRVYAEREDLGFYGLATEEENEELLALINLVSTQSGLKAFQTSLYCLSSFARIILRHLPKAIEETQVEFLLIDETVYLSSISIADSMNIPYGTMANAMSISHAIDGPPFLTTWQHSDSMLYRLRDAIAWGFLNTICPSTRDIINEWRQEKGLPLIPAGTKRDGGLIQVAQQPAFFEFPKSEKVLPRHFFYTSPWHKLDRDSTVSFPYEKINPQKQLIYASLGTVQNNLLHLYQNICKACKGIEDVQLVIALGKEDAKIDIPESKVPSDCIIVGFAPQLYILRKASVVITHCGMNTCLETLAHGIPAVAIPVTNDQPGVAARWQSLRAITLIDSPRDATPDRIRHSINELLPETSSYRKAAKHLQSRLQKDSLTLDETAELIEVAFQGKTPLTRCDVRAKAIVGQKQVEPAMR